MNTQFIYKLGILLSLTKKLNYLFCRLTLVTAIAYAIPKILLVTVTKKI